MADKKYVSPLSAIWSGASNMFEKKKPIGELKPSDDLTGKTCLITGANSGLGFAVSVQLAERGDKVIMACRSQIPEAGEEVKKQSGSEKIEMEFVDLSDMESIDNLISSLKEKGTEIDIFISNAAVVPKHSQKTKQGFELMFFVNYLAPFYLTNQIIDSGLLKSEKGHPRIVIVSSESHRSGDDLNFETLGDYTEFKMSQVLPHYGYQKLALTTFARELDRRLNVDGFKVGVHSLCPGAVNTNIARSAPPLTKPLLKVIFGLFFQDPEKAAGPVVYLAASNDLEGQTGIYLHMWNEKPADERARDPENGAKLWEKSVKILDKAKVK
jgi:NAD(P)-dependent dehydrogenase (short-subunit alcohol dehydrogenase family)